MTSDDYTRQIEQFLQRHRIEHYRFEQRGRRRAVGVRFGAKLRTVTFPSSGSDWRICTLRRALGLVGR
jgi:hypothetical protein